MAEGGNCSRCNGPRNKANQRYCLACSNAYMREWRKMHRLSGLARKKMNARAYANVYFRRGKLSQLPCSKCGSRDSQKHHPDYEKPLLIEWLCKPCHLQHHRSAVNG